ncbi:NrfA- nitrite reduction protein [bacterium]|nr:NrfA- nitrite reduction protein [bacterium]
MSNVTLWAIWLLLTVGLGGLLACAVPTSDSTSELSTVFLPGETTHGHYQIEMKCAACHEPGGSVREESCRDCHAAELRQARDTHPESKFRDPTKAKLLQHIDARSCIACHSEHVPERTHAMGLTLPTDYCFHCHQSIGEDRPSHAAFQYDSCATAGCHNYHDNTALYENFLLKHAGEPDILESPLLRLRRSQTVGRQGGGSPFRSERQPLGTRSDRKRLPTSSDPTTSNRPTETVTRSTIQLTIDDHDALSSHASDHSLLTAWVESSHARAGVNCSGCHQPKRDGGASRWSDAVGHETCRQCHASEVDGFLASRHGMRLAAGLSRMQPSNARLPMKSSAAHESLTCNACHPAHRYDTAEAAVAACLKCHDDQHSREYAGSSHYRLWLAEVSGKAPAGSGVSCASCHLPRTEDGRVSVEHNQNANLRPKEKMVRSVCLNCHGLQFSLDALADPQLTANCYSTPPSVHVESLDMAQSWFESKSRKGRSHKGLPGPAAKPAQPH